MKEFILLFDIPRDKHKVEVKVWRDLHKMGAKIHQHSVWKHNNLSSLTEMAMFIKKSGGTATILEEKLIF